MIEVSSESYYGSGYQDMQHRVPAITNTRSELEWEPRVGMQEALALIFDAYRYHLGEAESLVA